MLYREIMAVCSQIHTKHINTVGGRNVEFVNVKLVVRIMTTGLFRTNIGLDGGALFVFAEGWTFRNYQVKNAKLKLKFLFGVLKTCSAHNRYLALNFTSTEKN